METKQCTFLHTSQKEEKSRKNRVVAKVKQVVTPVSSLYIFLNFYYDEIFLIAVLKETNSFIPAWKT